MDPSGLPELRLQRGGFRETNVMSSQGGVPERECCAEQEGAGEEEQREHTGSSQVRS